MKTLYLLALCILLVSSLTLDGYQIINVESSQENHLHILKASQPFALRLVANPTTGYDWYIENESEFTLENSIEFVRSSSSNGGEYSSDLKLGNVGIGGHTYFKFNGNNLKGRFEVRLIYRRSWEKEGIRKVGVAILLE